jgi:hypothetical protein
LKDFAASQALTLVGTKKLKVTKQETNNSKQESETKLPQIEVPPVSK